MARMSTSVVLLGTAGGPIWWPGSVRAGIASALVVGDAWYLVDCGDGAGRRIEQAGLLGPAGGRNDLSRLRAVFLTHLHSDHICDYPTLLLYGHVGGGFGSDGTQPVEVHGPGRRHDAWGDDASRASQVVRPELAAPGTVDLTSLLVSAFATDLNDRTLAGGSPSLLGRLEAKDIASGPHEEERHSAGSGLLEVYEDDRVRVTATTVPHGEMVPSFAFRFETDDATVVFSGDTARSERLIELAQDCDLLVHEAIHDAYVRRDIAQLPVSDEVKRAYRDHMLGDHTMLEEVGDVAAAADARKLVLNHLVPGHLPSDAWTVDTRQYAGDVVVGEDLMRVPVSAGAPTHAGAAGSA